MLPSNNLISPSSQPVHFIIVIVHAGLLLRDGNTSIHQINMIHVMRNVQLLLHILFYLPGRHLTPTSWECVQELAPLELVVQFMSSLSLPVH